MQETSITVNDSENDFSGKSTDSKGWNIMILLEIY